MLEQDHKFIRDTHSKAVINTDIDGLRRYKARKAETQKIVALKNEVDSIKDEMVEIKDLLKQLIENQIR